MKARIPFVVAAAVCPILFGAVALGIAIGALRGDVQRAWVEAGWAAYGVALVSGLGGALLTLLLVLRGRGSAIPAAAMGAVAGLPWWVGLAGKQVELRAMEGALAAVNPADRWTIFAAGSGEANASAFFGYSAAMALFAALGVGLPLATLARPSTRAHGLGALGGLLLALPALVFLFRSAGATGGSGLLTLGAVALALAASAAVAGALLGDREVPAPEAATALCGLIFAGLALAAGLGAAQAQIVHQTGTAMAMVEPSDRATLLVAASRAAGPLAVARRWALPLSGLPLLGLLLWVAARRRLSLLGGAGLLGTAALAGLCAWQVSVVGAVEPSLAESYSRLAWAGVADFEALRNCAGGTDARVTLVLTRDALHGVGPSPVPWSSGQTDGLTAALDGQLESLPTRHRAPTAPGMPALESPELVVALDRRLTGPGLQTFLAAAQKAGAHSVRLAGFSEEPSPEAMAAVSFLPLAYGLARPQGLTPPILLSSAATDEAAEHDETLWHGRLMNGVLHVEPRPHSAHQGFDVPGLSDESSVGDENPSNNAYIEVTDLSSAQGLASAASGLALHQLRIVAVLGALPGHPARAGSSDDAGPPLSELDKASIQRVVLRHSGQMRQCYERELLSHPRAMGKVVFEFVIAASGEVNSPRVTVSDVRSPEMEACLARALASWRFPRHQDGDVTVAYPFVFHPTGER